MKNLIIVTGGAGFIGHHLVKLLLQSGHEVEVWDDLSTGKRERIPEGITFRQINIGLDVLPKIKADWVFHLAAPVSVQESLENPYKYEQGCYMNTKRVIDWAISHGVKDFAFASTAKVADSAIAAIRAEIRGVIGVSLPYFTRELDLNPTLPLHFDAHEGLLFPMVLPCSREGQ